MERRTFFALAGVIFSVATLIHLLRSVLRWEFTVGVTQIPMVVSWIIVIAVGIMAYYSFKFMKKEK